MESLLTVAGLVTWTLLAVAVGSLLVWGAADACRRILNRYEQLIRLDERRECGNRLGGAAWWFSEDKPTMDVLQRAALDLRSGVDPLWDIDSVRDMWRQQRKPPVSEAV